MKKLFIFIVGILISTAGFSQKTDFVYESFENNFLPTDWEVFSIGTSDMWTQQIGWGIGASNAILCTSDGYTEHQQWIVTPAINLTGTTEPRLTFYMKKLIGMYLESTMKVMISTEDQTTVSEFVLLQEWTEFDVDTPWEKFQVDLNAYIGETCYLAFVFELPTEYNSGNNWLLDNIRVFDPYEKDLAVFDIEPKMTSLGQPVSPVVSIENVGLTSQSNYSVKLNDGVDYDETIDNPGTISADGGALDISFPSWTPDGEVYNFTAEIIFSEDDNPADNELVVECYSGIYLGIPNDNFDVNTCASYLYDDGGPQGDYSCSQHNIVTIYPDDPLAWVEIEFTEFKTLSSGELRIYEGEDITAPLLGMWNLENSPGKIEANICNTSHALTIEFESTSPFADDDGFVAYISCHYFENNDLAIKEISPNLTPIGQAIVPQVTVLNNGHLTQDTYSVQLTDGNSYDETIEITSEDILSAEEKIIDFPEWMPQDGSNLLTATVTLVGDQNIDNDTKTSECFAAIFLGIPSDDYTVTACNSLFYDDGGPDNNYSAGIYEQKVTIYPENSGSAWLIIDFTEFEIAGASEFYVWNGEDETADLLFEKKQVWHPDPEIISATRDNPTGALTIKFKNIYLDPSSTDPGFIANVTCLSPPDKDYTIISSFPSDIYYANDCFSDIPQATIYNNGLLTQNTDFEVSFNFFDTATGIEVYSDVVTVNTELETTETYVVSANSTWSPPAGVYQIIVTVNLPDDQDNDNDIFETTMHQSMWGKLPDLNSSQKVFAGHPVAYSGTHGNKIFSFGEDDNIKTVYIYDVDNEAWSTGTNVPRKNMSGAASVIDDNYIFLHQGSEAYGYGEKRCYIYDIANDSWFATTDVPHDEYYRGTAATTVNGYVYLAGGKKDVGSSGNTSLGYVSRYNPATEEWTIATELPEGQYFGDLINVNNKLVYIWGANDDGQCNKVFIGEIDPDNPDVITWTEANTQCPEAGTIGKHAYTVSNTSFIVTAGRTLGGEWFNSRTYTYNIETDNWSKNFDKPISVYGYASGFFEKDDDYGYYYVAGGREANPSKAVQSNEFVYYKVDYAKPQPVIYYPEIDAVDVPIDTDVFILFNMDIGLYKVPNITITDGVTTNNVSANVENSSNKLQLLYDLFEYETVYTVTIPANTVMNSVGVFYDEEITWSFQIMENVIPTVINPIENQETLEDEEYIFTFAEDVFFDDGVLEYTANLSNDTPLPNWLNFDADNRTFTGTPENNDVGIISIKLTATDIADEFVSCIFDLEVINVNDSPTLDNPIPDLIAEENQLFTYTFPENTFSDVDIDDELSYTAHTSGQDVLPAWLNFDNETRTFSGTPSNDDIGNETIVVIASDNSQAEVEDEFIITVNEINNILTLENKFIISPNPANEFITITKTQNFILNSNIEIYIYNILSKCVKQTSMNNNELSTIMYKYNRTSCLSYLEPGTYILKIQTKNQIINYKINIL